MSILNTKVQRISPRDRFETSARTVEEWLSSDEEDGLMKKHERWDYFVRACAAVADALAAEDGLRQPPRVSYDPVDDQFFIIFKASNNGTTFIVSPDGVSGLADQEV